MVDALAKDSFLSSYMVIAAASEALRQVVWDSFRSDARIARHVQSRQEISLRNPTDAGRDSANKLSLWLYNISLNEFMRNDPPARSDQGRGSPPLALNLHYLVTPLSPDGDLDLMLIGKVLQTLNDTPSIFLLSDLDDIREEMRVTLAKMSSDETSRIWEALKEPYRLSVCYQVRVARIDAEGPLPTTAPVIDRFSGIGFTAAGGAS